MEHFQVVGVCVSAWRVCACACACAYVCACLYVSE